MELESGKEEAEPVKKNTHQPNMNKPLKSKIGTQRRPKRKQQETAKKEEGEEQATSSVTEGPGLEDDKDGFHSAAEGEEESFRPKTPVEQTKMSKHSSLQATPPQLDGTSERPVDSQANRDSGAPSKTDERDHEEITSNNEKRVSGDRSSKAEREVSEEKEPYPKPEEAPKSPPKSPPKQRRPASLAVSDQTKDLPSAQSSPPRTNLRKAFSFFSRNHPAHEKFLKSPSLQPAQEEAPQTGSAADGAGSEGQIDDGAANRVKNNDRNSLKDRFKMLRMQEEAGVKLVDDEDSERPTSSGESKDAEFNQSIVMSAEGPKTKGHKSRTASVSLGQPAGPTINEKLAPGTAVGTTTGPTPDESEPVDWDLWQEVVYEGPAAVARTSPYELNQAITHGIPSAIRGVVWQVLAQSQSQELVSIYKDLVNKNPDGQKTSSELRPAPKEIKRESVTQVNGRPPEKSKTSHRGSTVVSSGSSMHSAQSSPASPSGEAQVGSPSSTHDSLNEEARAKMNEKLSVEQKKRDQDEANALRKLERTIKRDLGARTSYSKFLMSSGLQNGLFGICKAYALYDEEVGYAQGMNFVAMPLLFNMPEEEAFCLFVRLMNQYHLRDMFIQEMPGLHLHLYQFERLLEDFEPAVFCHLHRRGVQPQLYATQWFLTLFAYRFPLQLVLRVYDLILSEGLEGAILKFGIVLMQKNAGKLLEMKDMATLTTFLKERLFDVYIDRSPSASSVLESGFFGSAGGIDKEVYRADALVQDACNVKITPETLKEYTAEWEEKSKDEKQRQSELDNLRQSNTTLSAQVRNLEQRAQKDDTEHVQIASSLVRTQLENQRLLEDNESLTQQITDLRDIINAQPAEVEDKLRKETDRIMQRNMEVQNENRHLEETVAEMEGELVRCKVKLAEVEGEMENWRRRWSNLQGMVSGLGIEGGGGPGGAGHGNGEAGRGRSATSGVSSPGIGSPRIS